MCYGFLLVKNVVLNWQNCICQTWKNSPNVLVVYILSGEGHRGVGYDLRRRGIWDWFPSHPELREQAVTPSLHTRYQFFFIFWSRILSRYIFPGPFVTLVAVVSGIWDLTPPTPSSGSRPSRPVFTPGIRILYYGRGFEAGLSGSTCYLSGSYSRYLGLVNVPFHSDLNTPSLPRSSYDIYSAVY